MRYEPLIICFYENTLQRHRLVGYVSGGSREKLLDVYECTSCGKKRKYGRSGAGKLLPDSPAIFFELEEEARAWWRAHEYGTLSKDQVS